MWVRSNDIDRRERRWTKKPKDPRKRYEFHETGCSHHFL